MSSTGSSLRSGPARHEVQQDGAPQHFIWGEVEDVQGHSEQGHSDSPQRNRLIIRREKASAASLVPTSEDKSSVSRHEVIVASLTPSGDGGGHTQPFVTPDNEDHKVWTSRSGTDASSSHNHSQPDRKEEEVAARAPGQHAEGRASVGSQLHDAGQCRPCLFVHTQVGCQNGIACDFCHFHHRRKDKPRPCKGKRDRHKKLVGRMQAMMELNPTAHPGEAEAAPSGKRMLHETHGAIASSGQQGSGRGCSSTVAGVASLPAAPVRSVIGL